MAAQEGAEFCVPMMTMNVTASGGMEVHIAEKMVFKTVQSGKVRPAQTRESPSAEPRH
jgi:hypothetical protein